jgi:two-component system, chemotaxis family, protein-glutamate methylesterase/glutaminase
MTTKDPISVLVVDDSLVFREVLAKGISSDPGIIVVAKAVDPFDARDKIEELRPDVMVCDVEMPRMNGIEFIRRLLPQYPMPVIVVSTLSHAVFEAMYAGAVDFVAKPDIRSAVDTESFLLELIYKIKTASKAKVVPRAHDSFRTKTGAPSHSGKQAESASKIIAIGSSTGGTEAICSILKSCSVHTPGIAIVQHIPPQFSTMLAERLNHLVPMYVKEAQHGDHLQPGTVLIAPGDRHMRVKKIGESYCVDIFEGERVNGHCPSVDVLFESVAKAAGADAIGVILTGMGYDGAKGLLAMRRRGARTLGQDEESSVVYGMPKAARDMGAVEREVPLQEIPAHIADILCGE